MSLSQAALHPATPDAAVESDESPLASYETELPHTLQAPISHSERRLIRRYLDSPSDARHAGALAVLHLSRIRHAAPFRPSERLRHQILALYFSNRLVDLGAERPWVSEARTSLTQNLDAALASASPVMRQETHAAHRYFRQAFHLNREEDRYTSLRWLLADVLAEPNNVYTSFAIAANTLWLGGEADYDDPTALYDFVIGSFFSLRTIALARRLEADWLRDPETGARFRLASILGGFSVLQRRWLAKVHGDPVAVAALDHEHELWTRIHPAFHGFTYGLSFFEEPEHFEEGFRAWVDSFAFCSEVPTLRTCSDLPRFYFNLLSFQLGSIDFLLKRGDIEQARGLLGFRHARDVPTNFGVSDQAARYQDWTLGQDAWEHRERNFDAIAALYQNSPDDAPTHFFLKRKKWGGSTITCQSCHQTQAKQQSSDDMDAIQVTPEEVATIGEWPAVSTTWYGSAVR